MDLTLIRRALIAPILYPAAPSQRIFALYLASAVVLAYLVYRRTSPEQRGEQSFFAYLFPKAIYGHRSAVSDYLYFFLNRMLFFAFLGPMWLSADAISGRVMEGLRGMGVTEWSQEAGPVAVLAITGVSALVFDFTVFIAHYLQHKVPLLWEFHKVHHSAQVMTPFTVYRMHPVDDLLTMTLSAVLSGSLVGVVAVLWPGGVAPIEVLGLNLLVFLFYLLGYNLRHSHVRLDYGPFWSRIFISPLQHQVHHSKLEHHWDKNIGFIFAFWDRMFGTLYVPERDEKMELGLSGDEEKHFSNVLRLYVLPFRNAASLLFRRRA